MKTTALLFVWVAITGLDAQDKGSSPKIERKGAMAGLPSAPGPHIAKIHALGDNEWLCLGSPAPDPKWGKMTGRSWGAKMAYGPDVRGAFIVGEGPHAYIKPNGYQDDDVWFYDVHAHRWICIHPGTDTRTFTQQVKNGDLKVDPESGQIVDKTRQPIPVHTLIHAWGNLTYDTHEKKFVWQAKYNANSYFAARGLEEGVKLIQGAANAKLSSPWFYNTVSGRFERYPVSGEPPFGGESAENQLLYIPGNKQFFSAGRNGTAFFDPGARKWTEVPARGGPKGIDHGACYDPRRNRVYMGGGTGIETQKPEENFHMFDVKTSTWSRPNPKGNFPLYFASNGAFFNYDAVNDVAVIVIAGSKEVFAYHPETNAWSSPPTTGPKGGYPFGNGFYSPELNAHFFHFAGDGLDNGVVWVYRYKRASK